MTDDEFVAAADATKIPWIEFQAPGWMSIQVEAENGRLLLDPTRVMNYWRNELKTASIFAGFRDGDVKRPRMERLITDVALEGGGPLTNVSGQVCGCLPISSCLFQVAQYLPDILSRLPTDIGICSMTRTWPTLTAAGQDQPPGRPSTSWATITKRRCGTCRESAQTIGGQLSCPL